MDRRVERTKRHIYRAFFELLQKKDLDDITITELAKSADIDRRTFYMHYQSIQDVLEAFEQSIEDEVRELLKECWARGQTAFKDGDGTDPFDYTFFCSSLYDIMDQNYEFYKKLSTDKQSMFLRVEFKRILERAALAFVKDVGFRPTHQTELYISFCSYAITGLGCDFAMRKPPVTKDEFVADLLPLLRVTCRPEFLTR